jgi:hypothetical protein
VSALTDLSDNIGLSWLEGNPLRKLHGIINKRARISY